MNTTDQYRYFLSSWLEWATTGAPEGSPFNRAIGLCNNIYNLDDLDDGDVFDRLMHGIKTRDLCTAFPFGQTEYIKGREYENHHLLPARLDFVRSELERLA